MIPQHPGPFHAAIVAAEAGIEPALALALADELTDLTDQMNALACELGQDADVLRRHMTALQAIDRIVQTQQAVAAVLRSAAPATARLATISVDAVAMSLRSRYAEHGGLADV